MYYWDMTNSLKKRKQMIVSVVVRRMYYWDWQAAQLSKELEDEFQ